MILWCASVACAQECLVFLAQGRLPLYLIRNSVLDGSIALGISDNM